MEIYTGNGTKLISVEFSGVLFHKYLSMFYMLMFVPFSTSKLFRQQSMFHINLVQCLSVCQKSEAVSSVGGR